MKILTKTTNCRATSFSPMVSLRVTLWSIKKCASHPCPIPGTVLVSQQPSHLPSQIVKHELQKDWRGREGSLQNMKHVSSMHGTGKGI